MRCDQRMTWEKLLMELLYKQNTIAATPPDTRKRAASSSMISSTITSNVASKQRRTTQIRSALTPTAKPYKPPPDMLRAKPSQMIRATAFLKINSGWWMPRYAPEIVISQHATRINNFSKPFVTIAGNALPVLILLIALLVCCNCSVIKSKYCFNIEKINIQVRPLQHLW